MQNFFFKEVYKNQCTSDPQVLIKNIVLRMYANYEEKYYNLSR